MKTNETVAEIISETKVDIDYGNGVLLDLSGRQVVGIFDRIEAAHKREVAELKARLDAVVKNLEDMRKYCAFACVDQEDVDEILRVARGEGGEK